MSSIKYYSELVKLPTFIERYNYLAMGGRVGAETFGFNRYLNQALYSSSEWKKFRRDMIIRDQGCDLAIPDREIQVGLVLHHLNPITEKDILERNPCLFDPENVVCVSSNTHKAIHYGDKSMLLMPQPERRPNDTIPWR